MSNPLLLAVAGAYVWVAVDYWLAGKNGMALAFGAYAIANLGFIWANQGG